MEALKTIRPELLTLSQEQITSLLPYFVLFGGTCLSIILSVFAGMKPKWPVFIVSALSCVAGIIVSMNGFWSGLTETKTTSASLPSRVFSERAEL